MSGHIIDEDLPEAAQTQESSAVRRYNQGDMRWRERRGLIEEHWPASAFDYTPVNKVQGGTVDVQGSAAAGLTLAASEKYSRTNIPCQPSLKVFCLHADGRLAAQIPAHNRETGSSTFSATAADRGSRGPRGGGHDRRTHRSPAVSVPLQMFVGAASGR